jgi:hypothetical protein
VTILRIYLRGREWPLTIPQASPAHGAASIMWWTDNFGRLPPEARPAKAWIIAMDSTETVLNATGVGERVDVLPLAYIDPREVVAVHSVEVRE